MQRTYYTTKSKLNQFWFFIRCKFAPVTSLVFYMTYTSILYVPMCAAAVSSSAAWIMSSSMSQRCNTARTGTETIRDYRIDSLKGNRKQTLTRIRRVRDSNRLRTTAEIACRRPQWCLQIARSRAPYHTNFSTSEYLFRIWVWKTKSRDQREFPTKRKCEKLRFNRCGFGVSSILRILYVQFSSIGIYIPTYDG